MKLFLVIFLSIFFISCSSKVVLKNDTQNIEIANYAKKYDGEKKTPNGFRNDCSGYVRMVYSHFDIDLFDVDHNPNDSGSEIIYKFFEENGAVYSKKYRPQPGDVIFFDNTHDKNKDGKLNDPFTHVAIVLSVDSDNTITYIHRSSRGINIQGMNLYKPNEQYI
ncbi:CHAP domain-containing protein, partial [bacterium]|nr:CHAP domain-containing protein [bacterium]